MTTTEHAAPQDLIRLGVRPSLVEYIRDVWRHREFAVTVPLAELKAQNADTVLGSVWHLLNPLLLAAVFYVVFGIIFQQARGDVNYIAVLLTGILTFNYTAKTLASGSRAVISNISLITSMYFPRIVLPLSALIAETIAHLPAVFAMFVLVGVSGERPHWQWLFVVPILLTQTVFNFGLAMVAARLTVHFRDVQQLLPFIIRIGMYTSGVFFTIDKVPQGWPRLLLELNPVYVFIALTRHALIDGTTSARLWLLAVTWALVTAVGAFIFFFSHESEYSRA